VLTSLAGGDILAERFGRDPVRIIALHGWGRTGSDFAGVLDGMDALAIHLPGFGPAPAPATPWTTADYASWLARGLEDTGPVVILAHSFGGRIALHLAVDHPHLVAGLVVTGVPLMKRDQGRKAAWQVRVGKTLHRVGLVSDARLESLRQRFGSADYRAASGVMRGVLVKAVTEDYRAMLPRVTQPTIMVWGERDIPAPLSMAQEAVELFPNATLRVVGGSGHLIDQALAKALRQAVTDLGDQESKGASP
jgi:pimeloyl-ACP methyl ester carboxylesterase